MSIEDGNVEWANYTALSISPFNFLPALTPVLARESIGQRYKTPRYGFQERRRRVGSGAPLNLIATKLAQ